MACLGAYSASLDRRSEDVCVLPIIVTELELGNIQRHVLAAHFVECANHAALENRPKAFDGLGMDCANDVLPSNMVNDAMWIFAVKTFVAGPLVRANQADLMQNRFADKSGESVRAHVIDNVSDHIAFALDG